jgi:hypothetical protein
MNIKTSYTYTIANILLSFVNNSFCSNTKRSLMKTLLTTYSVYKFSSSNMTNMLWMILHVMELKFSKF